MSEPRSAGVPVRHSGWQLLAFVGELTDDITSMAIGDQPLAVLRDHHGRPAVFDARCPHRGADLGRGGTLQEGSIRCPFHGKSIALGDAGPLGDPGGLCVAEFRSVCVGDLLFVCLDHALRHDVGFVAALESIGANRRFVRGITHAVPALPEIVVENAFDLDHFSAVHRVPRVRSRGLGFTPEGAAWVDAGFEVAVQEWEEQRARVDESRFTARAYSPSLVMSTVGTGEDATVIITGAVGSATGSTVRVGYAVGPSVEDDSPALAALKEYSMKSLEQDSEIWVHLRPPVDAVIGRGDEAVELFRGFCTRFDEVPVR